MQDTQPLSSQDVERLCRRLAEGSRRIQITIHHPFTVLVDKGNLELMLNALLSNALFYSDASTPIRVTAQSIETLNGFSTTIG